VFFWAIKKGIVKSTEISLQTKGLTVPELIQATSTKQYDVVQTAVIAIPPAVARGLELRIVSNAMHVRSARTRNGMYVRKDSPLQSAADLKGKVLAPTGCAPPASWSIAWRSSRNTGSTPRSRAATSRWSRSRWRRFPRPWRRTRSTRATLVYSQAYIAEQSGDFRVLAEAARNATKLRFPLRHLRQRHYPEKLAAYPNRFQEFLRLLRESLNYALSHREEVFGDVAKAYNLPPAYFTAFDKVYDVTPTVTMGQQKAIQDLLVHREGSGDHSRRAGHRSSRLGKGRSVIESRPTAAAARDVGRARRAWVRLASMTEMTPSIAIGRSWTAALAPLVRALF